GACSGTANCTVAATAAKSVTATFEVVAAPPAPSCPTDPSLCPPVIESKPKPKPIHCRKGFRKKKVKGKVRCVKIKKSRKAHRSSLVAISALDGWGPF